MFNNKIIPIFLWALILQGCKDVEVVVEGNGRVYDIVDAANINCGSGAGEDKCKNSYGTGVDSVTFKAEPDPGYRLKTWGNNCKGDVCSSTFLDDIPESLKVSFEKLPAEIAYTYNASGQRVSKTVDGVTTFYIYQQDGSLLAELDKNGNTLVDYIYLEGKPIAQVRPQSGGTEQAAYIHVDHIGAPKAATSQSGEVIWQVKTTPFGEVYSETGTLSQNQRFPGQYADQESGYSYNYFRDYDSSLGRYLQSDPIGLEGGLNTYAYVLGKPLILVDPTGLGPVSGAGCASFFTGYGIGEKVHSSFSDQESMKDDLLSAYDELIRDVDARLKSCSDAKRPKLLGIQDNLRRDRWEYFNAMNKVNPVMSLQGGAKKLLIGGGCGVLTIAPTP